MTSSVEQLHDSSSNQSDLGLELIGGIVVCLLAIALWVGAGFAQTQIREQGAFSTREAIMRAAVQCFAIEGSYPPSLTYLEKSYGLSVNHDLYVVHYDNFASNIAPQVAVSLR